MVVLEKYGLPHLLDSDASHDREFLQLVEAEKEKVCAASNSKSEEAYTKLI